MAEKETILTAGGLQKLQDELDELVNVKRPEVVQRLKEARAQGDLSENAEYDQAKEDQGNIEGRIKELEKMIETAKIIEKKASSEVSLASVVVLRDEEFGDEETYTIVGPTEADPFAGKISNESPVGVAILGKKAGDVVEVNTPAGVLKYVIVSVE